MSKEPKYLITIAQLNEIALTAAQEAVKLYCEEEAKQRKKAEGKSAQMTKKKLQSYRRVKASLEETEEFTDDEKIELRWAFVKDLMGSGLEYVERAEGRIRSIESKRKRNMFEISSIDKAMSLYQQEADRTDSEEFKRRFRELYAMYIGEDEKGIKEIADAENISEKIVYRDLGIACKILSVYLLGM